MSDLTERLRAQVVQCPGAGITGHRMSHCAECCFGTGVAATSAEEQELMLLCRDAADRIQQLEDALEWTRQQWVDGEDPMCEDVCEIACKGPCGFGGKL